MVRTLGGEGLKQLSELFLGLGLRNRNQKPKQGITSEVGDANIQEVLPRMQ